jgi:hypothetical protein
MVMQQKQMQLKKPVLMSRKAWDHHLAESTMASQVQRALRHHKLRHTRKLLHLLWGQVHWQRPSCQQQLLKRPQHLCPFLLMSPQQPPQILRPQSWMTLPQTRMGMLWKKLLAMHPPCKSTFQQLVLARFLA